MKRIVIAVLLLCNSMSVFANGNNSVSSLSIKTGPVFENSEVIFFDDILWAKNIDTLKKGKKLSKDSISDSFGKCNYIIDMIQDGSSIELEVYPEYVINRKTNEIFSSKIVRNINHLFIRYYLRNGRSGNYSSNVSSELPYAVLELQGSQLFDSKCLTLVITEKEDCEAITEKINKATWIPIMFGTKEAMAIGYYKLSIYNSDGTCTLIEVTNGTEFWRSGKLYKSDILYLVESYLIENLSLVEFDIDLLGPQPEEIISIE